MKSSTWTALLDELVTATSERRVKWRPTDSRGTYVAAFEGTSVLVRNLSTDAGVIGGVSANVFGGPIVELLDASANAIASIGRELGVAGSSGVFRDESSVATATDDQLSQIRMLASLIVRAQGEGELAALRIINRLRGGGKNKRPS
jgi:hypothetical protein